MKYFVVVIALFALQGVLAAPQKKAPQATDDKTLQELATKTEKVIADARAKLEKDLPDTKQVTDVITKQTQELATTLKTLSKKIDDEYAAHKPEMQKQIQDLQKKFTEASAKLEEVVGKDTAEKAKKLKTQLDTQLKDAYTEIEKLVKASEPDVKKAQDGFNDFAKSAFESLGNLGKTLQESLKTAVEDHAKTHKH